MDLELATPCSVSWDSMEGDARSRFCGSCSKHVYDLSALTEAGLRALIIEKEGQFCGRFFQRADGTVLTRDCWVGIAKLRRKVFASLAVSLAVIAGVLKWAGVWSAATEVGAFSAQLRPPPPIRIALPMKGVPAIPSDYAERRVREAGTWEFQRPIQGRMSFLGIIRGTPDLPKP